MNEGVKHTSKYVFWALGILFILIPFVLGLAMLGVHQINVITGDEDALQKAIKNQDPSYCEKAYTPFSELNNLPMADKKNQVNFCYRQYAIEAKDVSFCTNFHCLPNATQDPEKDYQLCFSESISIGAFGPSRSSDIAECLGNFAGILNDPMLCKENITSNYWSCYSAYLRYQPEISFCESLEKDNTRLSQRCYFQVAQTVEDQKICDNITDLPQAQNCRERIQRALSD